MLVIDSFYHDGAAFMTGAGPSSMAPAQRIPFARFLLGPRPQRGPRNPLLRNALDRLNKALEADSSPLARALIQEAMGAIRESEGA